MVKSHFKRWRQFSTGHVFKSYFNQTLFQYVWVGGLSACVDLSAFALLSQWTSLHYLVSATLSFFLATLLNFYLCQRHVFKEADKYSHKTQLSLTYLVSGLGLSIHHLVLFAGIELFHLSLVWAKLGAMGIAFNWNFLARKHLVFCQNSL